MPNKKTNKQTGWKDLIQVFVANMLEHVGENLSLKLHNWITQMKRRAIGSVFMAVGVTFFLNGIAIYLNAVTNSNFFGYGIVGLTTVFVGYVLVKE